VPNAYFLVPALFTLPAAALLAVVVNVPSRSLAVVGSLIMLVQVRGD
jgi:hypothetical protein